MTLISNSPLVYREGLEYRLGHEVPKIDKGVTMSWKVSKIADI